MNQLLIADNATYAAKTGGGTVTDLEDVVNLANGAMAIFTEDGTLITAATVLADIAMVKQFIVAARDNAGLLWQSIKIDRDAFFRGYCAYVAPVNQVKAVGYNGATGAMNFPTTLVVGDEAEIAIAIYDETIAPGMKWYRANYTVRNGDTAATVVAALIAAINAIPYCPVTAAAIGANLGISLTANDIDTRIEIRLGGIAEDADISTTTDLVYGKGTPDQVAAMEKLSWAEEGYENRITYAEAYWSVASAVDPAATYDLFSVNWTTEQQNAVGTDVVANPRVTLAIGDATLRASVNTILTTKVFTSIPNTGSGSSDSQL